MNPKLVDLYTGYLISSFSYTTPTGLSRLLDGKISHDKISRFLREEESFCLKISDLPSGYQVILSGI